ncbi:LPD38 domain-containing protein [Gorillibacterium timonense]|uniref:LPD38 domain-containing protein n=1 Tax=Gorillibacterium timonense TaxID=1689269 RepID=UPI00071CCD10|nr:LPD38 domain-containing protein [Gorillibacterium timonense]
MSKYDALRKSFGLTEDEKKESKYDSMRRSMGLLPDLNAGQVDPMKAKAKEIGSISESPIMRSVKTPSLPSSVPSSAVAQPVDITQSPLPAGRLPDIKPTKKSIGKRILDTIQYPFDKAAELLAPSAPFLDGQADEYGATNPRDRLVAQHAEAGRSTTGNKTLDKVGDVLGTVGAFVANPAKVPSLGQIAELPGIANLSSRAGAAVSSPVASRAASVATREGLTGAAQGAQYGLQTGNGDLRDAAREAAFGLVGGAALGGVGGALAQKLGPKLSAALESFRQRSSGVSADAESQVQGLLQAANKPYGTLRSAPSDVYLNRAMSELQPLVSERMTPPLENPNELAKWLKPYLGDDVSLNEIRKLPYDDMSELAGEVQRNLKTYDVANQVARERGIDLDGLLNGKQPTNLNAQIERNRMGQAAGAIDAPQITPARAVPKDYTPSSSAAKSAAEATPAETMKGNWFTNLFGSKGVGISAVSDSQRLSKGPLTTEDQIVSRSIKRDVQGTKVQLAASGRALYQNLVDRLDPLKRISAEAYDTAMDSSRANNIANTIIKDKFVNPEGEVIGESLSGIFRKVARGEDKPFIDYLTLRHAVTRMERGEQVYADNLGMTVDGVKDKLAQLDKRYPGFSEIAKEWDGFNDNVLQTFGVDEGLISPEAYAAMREKNPNYSPMRRQFLQSEKPGRTYLAKSAKSSFSGQNAPIKEVSPTGSARRIVDPRKTTVEAVGAWANAAMRNRTMQSVVDAVKRDPEAFAGVVEIVAKPKSMASLEDVLTKGGADDFLESLDADFKDLFKTSRVDGDNVVRAMVDGQPVYMKVHDPELIKTLVGMGPQSSNALIDVLSLFSNATKRGATGLLAPVFAVKGATMDLVQGAIQSRNPVKQTAYTVYALLSGIGDRLRIPGLRNLAEEYRRAGGEYSAALKGDRALDKSIDSMTRYPLLAPQSVKKGVIGTVAAPFKALEAVGNVTENAPRMAAYKVELNRLGGERTPDNVRQAMNQAREITTNFSRRGAMSRDLEAFVPYNNAAVQGTYRVLKGLKDRPVQTVAAIGALSVLPKVYEYMQFADDPEYQSLPARERYRFLIVSKNADGTFVKIPMEPAYNSFGELTVESLRKWKDQDPTAFKGAADALANAWTPPLLTGALQGATTDGSLETGVKGAFNSTVFAPLVAISGNQSFTGAPIVSKAVADRSPKYQSDERTSSIAMWIGEQTNMSPMKVDYMIRAYGGDAARLTLPLTSQVGAGNVRNTLLRNFIVDPAFSNTLTNDFYDAKTKLNQAYRDYTEAGVQLPTWYNENLRKALNSTANGSILKRLATLKARKNLVNADKSLTAEQRTDKLREIQTQTNQIYIDINSALSQAGVIK